MEKKLDSKTTSCYFEGYLDRTKGYRFYSLGHTTRFVETGRAIFLENDGDIAEEREFDFEELLENTGRREEAMNQSTLPVDLLSSTAQETQPQQITPEALNTIAPMQIEPENSK